ncbi:MAG: glycosyltransferase family 9 protein [Cyanobacteria bacterium P01_E01_bin.34]
MRILALVPGDVSDQVLFFPTLQALRDTYPDAQIHAIAERKGLDAYRVCPSVDTVIPFDFQESLSLADLGNLLGQMRDAYYDAVVALSDDALLRFFIWLSGIPKRVGYSGKANVFLTDRIACKSEQYEADMYSDLLQAFSISPKSHIPQVRFKKGDLAWAEETRMTVLGKKDADYLLIYPGHGDYPVDKWLSLVRSFREKRPELPVVVVTDDNNAVPLQAGLSDVAVMAPDNVGQLAAAIAGATLVVCPDSAAMQLAVAAQTPTVALFGDSKPARRLPADGPYRAVQSKSGKLADIEPEAVVSAIFPE